MSDALLLLAVFWAAINPPASVASLPDAFEGIERETRRALAATAWVVAAALLALAALLHGPFLDLLDVSAPSFDIAAGIIMLAGAARPLLRGRAVEEVTASLLDASPRAAIVPLAVPCWRARRRWPPRSRTASAPARGRPSSSPSSCRASPHS